MRSRFGTLFLINAHSRLLKNACEVISEHFHRILETQKVMSKCPTDSWVSKSIAISKVLAALFACSAQLDTLILMPSLLHSPLPGSECEPCCKWRRPA